MTGIVIVLYNSAPDLPDFFRSLEGQTHHDFTLYIVDNASPDESLELARKLSATVSFSTVFIENPVNGGIARGNNLGIRAARRDGCQWVLLSNNDTIWRQDTLDRLLKNAETTGFQIVVPKILHHATGRIWYAGGRWDRLRGGTAHFKQERLDTGPVEYAPSCCMLIHSTVFDRIGVMDEQFFLYYDDSDFVRRAADASIPIGYTKQAVIEHKEGGSTGAVSPLAQYWLSRNLLIFTHKHHSTNYFHYVLLVNLAILFIKRPLTFGREEWRASRDGFRDGIRCCREKNANESLREVWQG
jgi:GT2 family glycosyltransferase